MKVNENCEYIGNIYESKKESKLAVIFPGLGYHTDKPLLYYSKKMAANNGFTIKEVMYGGFETGIKGSKDKMMRAYESALQQTEELLEEVDFSQYSKLLFISKSIGTAVAVSFAKEKNLDVKHILFTPVEETFLAMPQEVNAVAFHGTGDPWVETRIVKDECHRMHIPLYITQKGNHSLETGNVLQDLCNLQVVMEQCQKEVFI